MWANSYLMLENQLLDGTAIHGIHLANRTPSNPNALLIRIQGRDWHNKPKYFTQIEWQRVSVDFAARSGEMNINQAEVLPPLSQDEKQRLSNLLTSLYPKAWSNSGSLGIRKILV